MADRYKLLKDINYPGCYAKSGTIGVKMEAGNYYSFSGEETGYCIHAAVIDKQPDWFQKIEEEPIRQLSIDEYLYIMNRNVKDASVSLQTILDLKNANKFYTEQDLTQARIDAFNAARSKEIVPMETPMNKYTSAEDYLQSLNNK